MTWPARRASERSSSARSEPRGLLGAWSRAQGRQATGLRLVPEKKKEQQTVWSVAPLACTLPQVLRQTKPNYGYCSGGSVVTVQEAPVALNRMTPDWSAQNPRCPVVPTLIGKPMAVYCTFGVVGGVPPLAVQVKL